MNYKRSRPLDPGQLPNPVVSHCFVKIPPEIPVPTITDMLQIFHTGRHSLQTWGRTGAWNGPEPHWIGVYKPTDLHTDPMYPHYTHHLMLRIDPGMGLRGLDGEETMLQRGMLVVCDTWSPHQLFSRVKGSEWYLAASIDSDQPRTMEDVIPKLLDFAQSTPVLTPDILETIAGR